MNADIEPREAEVLVQGYLEGSLTERESARLASLLRNRPDTVGMIVSGLREDCLIRTVVAEGVVSSAAQSQGDLLSAPRFLQWWRLILGLWRRQAWASAVVGLATCAALAAGFGFWYFGPTMGEPVLAGIQGTGLSLERASRSLPALAGTRLQAGDMLRTPDNVTAALSFAPERTLITVQPGTELKVVAASGTKRFTLLAGKLEATVARQRPFRPMLLVTPQAEARVLGTKFSLLVTTNSTRLDVSEGKVRLTRVTDGSAVRVQAGYYAVAASGTVLAALPHTGGLLCEWWSNVAGKTRFALREDPRFPDRPENRDTIRDFELKLPETNQVGLRFRGYLHPPSTGEYEFFLEYSLPGSSYAEVTMSPNENPAEGVGIASTGRTGVGATQAPPPIPLVAGRRYYIEAQVLINSRGKGHLAVEWKRPKGSRELITSEFLSPYKPK